MSDKNFTYLKVFLSVLTYLGIPVLYYYFYRYHFLTFEEYQMFTFDTPYLYRHLCFPGGIMGYLGNLLTSFFHYPAGGPLILSAIFLMCGLQLSRLLKKIQPRGYFFAPSLLTAILMAMLHFNLMIKVSVSVMFLFTLLLANLYTSIRPPLLRRLLAFPLLLLAYWAGAIASLILCSIIVIWELFVSPKRDTFIFVFFYLLTVSVIPPIARHLIQDQHPMSLLSVYMGDVYTADKVFIAEHFLKIWLAPAVYMLFLIFLNYYYTGRKEEKKSPRLVLSLVLLQLCMLSITSYAAVKNYMGYREDEQFLRVDYLVKQQQWEELAKLSLKELPPTPISYPYINLAWAQTGHLSQGIGIYPDNTPDNMIMPFMQDYLTAKMLSEILFHLGDIANSQHLAFESMISTPGGENVYMLKRLAECAMILKEYRVAQKYLQRLSLTPVYGEWADLYIEKLKKPQSLDAVDWIKEKRALLPKRNEILYFDNIMSICIPLINANGNNQLAFEYCATVFLITKDIDNFYKLYQNFNPYPSPDQIPTTHQQALLVYMNTHRIPSEQWGGKFVSQETLKYFEQFSQRMFQYNKAKKDIKDPAFQNEFGKTYWYYYMTKNQPK